MNFDQSCLRCKQLFASDQQEAFLCPGCHLEIEPDFQKMAIGIGTSVAQICRSIRQFVEVTRVATPKVADLIESLKTIREPPENERLWEPRG